MITYKQHKTRTNLRKICGVELLFVKEKIIKIKYYYGSTRLSIFTKNMV